MKLFIEGLLAACMWLPVILLSLIGIVSGIFVVPVALLFTSVPKHVDKWKLVLLPEWAYLWDNLRDGALGDHRLDYWTNGKQYPLWFDKMPLSQYVKAYYWLAIRNPANTLKRFVPFMGCQLGQEIVKLKHGTVVSHEPRKTIELLAGQEFVSDTAGVEGYQFVKAKGKRFSYWGFYLYKRVSATRFLMIRLGHKIEPRYTVEYFEKRAWQGADKVWKGTTFRITLRGERK